MGRGKVSTRRKGRSASEQEAKEETVETVVERTEVSETHPEDLVAMPSASAECFEDSSSAHPTHPSPLQVLKVFSRFLCYFFR
jgi:hypothetical protein